MFRFCTALTQFAEFKLGNFFNVPSLGEGNSELRDPLTKEALLPDASRGEDQCHSARSCSSFSFCCWSAASDVPYSGAWGYYPSGGLGLVLVIVLILLLLGRI
jgi:hypothetical protein